MGLPFYIHTIRRLYDRHVQAGLPDGRWVYAVPEPYDAGRIQAAWWVLTGRAYAFAWPKAGDLEEAIGPQANNGPKEPTGKQAKAVNGVNLGALPVGGNPWR